MPDRAQVIAELTAPGARFESMVEDVRGVPMRVFKQRHRCLVEILEASLAFGDREYLVTSEERIGFAEHHRRAAALAAALREEYGVGAGDRVALCAANRTEWIIAFWATVSLGAVTVGMNSMWAAPEIGHGVELTTPKVIVTDPTRLPLVREALGPDSAVGVILLDPVLDEPSVDPSGTASYAGLLSRYAGAKLEPTYVDEDEPAVILFTSGTTGRPKGATHSHRNMIAALWFHLWNDALAEAFGRTTSGRRFLLATPLFHIAALHNLSVIRMAVGDTAVLHLGRFDIDRVLALVEKERVTNWGAVPTMLTRLLDADLSSYDLSSLRTVSVNSAPSSSSLKERIRSALPAAAASLSTSYGLTESTTAATIATGPELLADPDTVGRPTPNMEVRIVDDEVQLRGPQVMLGYYNDEAATAAAFTDDGWFRTGDLGVMRDGALSLLSRRSDLILRGAENVYPAEVEDALDAHPDVVECIVAGMPDEEYGQIVAATVVVRGDVTAEELRDFLLARLARYKVPAKWFFVPGPLRRNATGKVVRQQIAWE